MTLDGTIGMALVAKCVMDTGERIYKLCYISHLFIVGAGIYSSKMDC